MNIIPVIPNQLKKRYLIDAGTDKVVFQHLRAKPELNRCPRANVPDKDFIYDEKSGETYEIYHRPRVQPDPKTGERTIKTDEIWMLPQNMGTIVCDLKSKRGRETYEYLCMSNYNASNPFRQKHVRPIFKMINNKAEAEQRISSEKEQVMAKAKVFDMKGEDVRQFADWQGLDSRQPIQVLRQELLKLAASKPSEIHETEELLKHSGEYLTAVIRGKRHNIIEVDVNSRRWRFSKSNVYIKGVDLDLSTTQQVINLAHFFKNGETSGKHYKKLLDALEDYKDQYRA